MFIRLATVVESNCSVNCSTTSVTKSMWVVMKLGVWQDVAKIRHFPKSLKAMDNLVIWAYLLF